ncbi:hypothetical protein [Nonomuraea longicatena]|uniref:Uncharacterized protein n=1 Tax=Nonomuraea longicatena TaxID=83682 RepID=A0ABP3Z2G1_9ACTN
MKAAFSPIWLPLDALVLAVRSFLPLAFFYTVGRVAHDLILVGAAFTGADAGPRKYLGFAVMSMAVLATLASYVAMLQVLRRSVALTGGPGNRTGRITTVIAHTLLPFLAFYGAWGLFVDDVRQYSILSQELFGLDRIDNVTFDPLLLTSVIALGAFLVKLGVDTAHTRLGRTWLGPLVTVFEALWMFFAVISVESFISARVEWLTSRAAWAGAADLLGTVLGPVGDAVTAVVPDLRDALLLPLVWLTIAAVVYGRDMGAGEALIEGTRLQPGAGRVRAAAPGPVRKAAEFVSRDLRGKYTPMLHGLRLVLRAGPVFYLVFCLCYALLEAGREWAFIGVTRLVGPHDGPWWTVWHGPVRFGVTAVYEVLRFSLLASALQMALRTASDGRGPRAAEPAAPRPAKS